MISSIRDLFDQNATINLIISFDESIKDIYIRKRNVVWYNNQKLEDIFKDFLRANNIKINTKYFLYLKRNGKILKKLRKQNRISYLKLKNDDEIVVSYQKKKLFDNLKTQENLTIKEENEENIKIEENKVKEIIEINDNKIIKENKKIEETIIEQNIEQKEQNKNLEAIECKEKKNKQRIKMKIIEEEQKEPNNNITNTNFIKHYNEKTPIDKFKNKKLWFIITIILLMILLLGISIFFIIRYFINKKNDEEIEDIPTEINTYKVEYIKEDLIINKKYPLNLLLRFNMVKKTKIEVEAGNSSENNISEISDFIFIVREEKLEKDEINLIEKELFIGYICLLNHSMSNETEDMLTIYDKQLNKYLNYNQTNITVPDLKYIGEEGNLCFVKIEFYLSGEIKNYLNFLNNYTHYLTKVNLMEFNCRFFDKIEGN